MPVSETKLIEAYRAQNLSQAYLIRSALEDAGHHVLIEESSSEYPPGWSTEPRILVDESHFAAATKIIGRIERGPASKLGPVLAWTVGLFVSMWTAIGLFGTTAIVCLSLVATVVLIRAYVRIRFGQSPNPGGTTRCLACDTSMAEAEATCPKCGWSYAKTTGLEPADESLEDS